MRERAPTPRFVAFFEDDHATLAAVTSLRQAGLSVVDVFSPYPIHGMDEALGLRPSRLTWVCFLGGLTGTTAALALQWWTSAVSWPLNVGGKPFNSLPAFIPVAFELTVLFAGLITVSALFLRTRLWPRLKPAFPLPGVTNDRFAIAVDVAAAGYLDLDETSRLCHRLGAVHTSIVEEEP